MRLSHLTLIFFAGFIQLLTIGSTAGIQLTDIFEFHPEELRRLLRSLPHPGPGTEIG